MVYNIYFCDYDIFTIILWENINLNTHRAPQKHALMSTTTLNKIVNIKPKKSVK
jgi:hypothetical protein